MRKKQSGLLSEDKNFVPASEDDGDELYPNGIFVFNITKMIEYIRAHKDEIPLESIEVKAHRTGLSKLNESHIDKTDITVPLILAEISPGRYNVIDGNHRAHKDQIPLESIEVKAYRTGFSKLNESHIDKTDITVPIILAEISPGRYNVIDGNHRLEKAYRMKVGYISAYRLKPVLHMPFFTFLNAYYTANGVT